MSKITFLEVEFLAGTDLESAIEEMMELREKYTAIIRTNFNGVKLVINGNRSVDEIVQAYERSIKGGAYD